MGNKLYYYYITTQGFLDFARVKCEFPCQGNPIFKRYLLERNLSTLPMNRWKQVLRKSARANKNDEDINENVIEKFLEEYFLHPIFWRLN